MDGRIEIISDGEWGDGAYNVKVRYVGEGQINGQETIGRFFPYDALDYMAEVRKTVDQYNQGIAKSPSERANHVRDIQDLVNRIKIDNFIEATSLENKTVNTPSKS